MALRSRDLSSAPDIKVFIQDADGKYLAGDATNWFFSEDNSRAIVLNYKADHVPEQLERIQQAHRVVLKAVPVPLADIYETCDRCKELFVPFMTFFDGKQFLCAECRSRASRRSGTRLSGGSGGRP
jgi:ubiquinone/menaquinone biosynthesis C-methylase UbiE